MPKSWFHTFLLYIPEVSHEEQCMTSVMHLPQSLLPPLHHGLVEIKAQILLKSNREAGEFHLENCWLCAVSMHLLTSPISQKKKSRQNPPK